jgi:hypothetical protein
LFGVHFVVAARHKSLHGTRTKYWTKCYVQWDSFSIRRCDKAICQNAKESPFSKGRLISGLFFLFFVAANCITSYVATCRQLEKVVGAKF